jgi:very-short-patch-repair endonuclease
MLRYDPKLKEKARRLRKHMTDGERILWNRLRAKQIGGVQFYRQKPIGNYIVDFYGPKVGLVIEIDGSQHREEVKAEKDRARDACMEKEGLKVLRFNSREVLKETDSVMEVIY